MLKKKILIISLFVALIGYAFRYWILKNAYHAGFGLLEIVWPLIVAVLIFSSVVILFLNNRIIYQILKFTLALGFIFATLKYFDLGKWLQVHLKNINFQLVIMVAVVIVTSWLVAFKLNETTWNKLAKSLIIATLIFIFTPNFIAAFSGRNDEVVLKRELDANFSNASKNLLFVVLDEWSIQENDPILNVLRKSMLTYQMNYIDSFGEATVDAIPSLLLDRKISDLEPCGTERLCSKSESINFQKLKSPISNLDIVGYWHPYCAIQGVRYCFREDRVFYIEPGLDLFCKTVKKLSSSLYQNFNCMEFKEEGSRNQQLKTMVSKIWSAPFWSSGGVLFTHLPTPHPNMEMSDVGLANEYMSELVNLSVLIEKIIERLESKFEEKYTLVITSDHHLRKEIWCDLYPTQLNRACDADFLRSEGKVPYIIVN